MGDRNGFQGDVGDEAQDAAVREGVTGGATPPDAAPGALTRREFVASTAAAAAAVAVLGVPGVAEAAGGSGRIFRIHPAIGVARLGNLDPSAGFIVGPEIPGGGPTDGLTGAPVASFKVNGQIKPQAARFRVFEYARDAAGRLTPIGEVVAQAPTPGKPFVKSVNWTVHVANRKSSFYEEDGPTGEIKPASVLRNPTVTDRASLESDFGPRTIKGASAAPQPFTPSTGGAYPVRWVRGADGKALIDYLGQLRTDSAGRLLVFAGKGKSASSLSPAQPISHWANNNSWFDDIADGPVTATVTIDDGYGHLTEVPMDAAGSAWVLAAPPDYSPGLNASVSLYDVLYDMAVRKLPIPTDNTLYADGGPLERLRKLAQAWDAWEANPTPGGFEFGSYIPDYTTEIWPIILNAFNLLYTTGLVNFKHTALMTDPLGDPSDAAAPARETFFSYLRAPEAAATNTNGPATMPRLYGDNWYLGNENFVYSFGQSGTGNAGGGAVQDGGSRHLPKYQRYSTLTTTQYGLLRIWRAGDFIPPPGASAPAPAITPHGLDRAALENCNGAPLYPGIECGWQMRNPALFIEPFRLNLAAMSQYLKQDGTPEGTPLVAGHFSRQMAIPWQADFNDCSKLLNLGWWPTARPDDVFLHPDDKLTQRVPWARPDTKFASGGTSATYEDMVANWYKFGFVLDGGQGTYIEKERNAKVP